MSEQRLIDANAPSNALFVSDFVIKQMKKIPTIEARPIIRGKWISPTKINGYIIPLPHCSECKEHQNDEANFCPNCGADMRGGSE